MDSNDELTIAARVKGWEIFTPDWDYLRQHPALQIDTLCALSVGLHPYFGNQSWVFNIAMPHFNGIDPDEFHPLNDADEGAIQAALLNKFLQRVHIAVANLVPYGTLTSADGSANAERTMVNVASFASWAAGMEWSLPPEFPRLLPATVNIQTAVTAGDPEIDEPPAPIARSEGKRGITKAEILDAKWPLPNNAPSLESILDKIPKWVAEACIKVGRAGKGQSGSHLWNPTVLAVCLATLTSHKRWKCNQVALTNLIRSQFPDYLDEWTKKQEML